MGAVHENGQPDAGSTGTSPSGAPQPLAAAHGHDGSGSENGAARDGAHGADPGIGSAGAMAGPPPGAAGSEPQGRAEPEPPLVAPDSGSAQAAPHPVPYAPAGHQQPYPGTYPPGPNPAVPFPPPPYSGQYHPTAPYPSGPYPPGPYPPYGAPAAGPPPYGAPAASPPRRGLRGWGAPAPKRTHRWGLGAYLAAEAVFLLVAAIIQLVLIGDQAPDVGVLVLALAAPTLLAAGTGLLITWWRGNGPRVDLCLGWSWREVGLGLAFGFGGLALTIPASIVYVAIVGPDATSAVGDVFGGVRAGPAMAVLVMLIVVFVAPMCEEILYRGLLWGGVEKLAGRWVAFGVTTVLFALAHFEFTRTPLLLVVAIPIAVARLYTGRLLPAIVAHQVNNLLPGIVLLLGLLGVVPMG